METIMLCGYYGIDLLCYQLGLQILFCIDQKIKKWLIPGMLMTILVGSMPIADSGKRVLVTLIVIGITYISGEGACVKKWMGIAFVFVLLQCLEDSFGWILNDKHFLAKCLTVPVLFAWSVLKTKVKIGKAAFVKLYIYLIIGISAWSMLLCLAAMNYGKNFSENTGFIKFCNILNIVIHISTFLLVASVVYIKDTHERMEALLKQEQMLKEMQVNHYKHLLKKEEDTRKYRHDINNHLTYIQELLKSKGQKEALTYLEQMQGELKDIQKMNYVTGNEVLDMIMNYFGGQFAEEVEIVIVGRTPVVLEMKEADICTVFSNIFQNIVEEMQEAKPDTARVEINIEKGKEFVKYEIKNTIHNDSPLLVDAKTGLPKTQKPNQQNHGIGLVNVKTVIERNHGKFAWNQKKGIFCVSVILPIKK